MPMSRTQRRETARQVWKALGKPGAFSDFWMEYYANEKAHQIEYIPEEATAETIVPQEREGFLRRITRKIFGI